MENNVRLSAAVPPYVAFATFQSAVQDLRDHGLPPEVDRSAWTSKSGADQSALISAFKFLGLTDGDGKTQDVLAKLVRVEANSVEEKHILGNLLRQQYAKVFALDLESATPIRLADAIGEYGATGSTKNRCIRFFLKAAEHSSIQMSGRLTKRTRVRGGAPTGNGGATKGRRRIKRKTPLAPSEGTIIGGATEQSMKTVKLPTAGGSLTLSGSFNLFELAGDERQLVFDIIDKMKAFGDATTEEGS